MRPYLGILGNSLGHGLRKARSSCIPLVTMRTVSLSESDTMVTTVLIPTSAFLLSSSRHSVAWEGVVGPKELM